MVSATTRRGEQATASSLTTTAKAQETQIRMARIKVLSVTIPIGSLGGARAAAAGKRRQYVKATPCHSLTNDRLTDQHQKPGVP